MSTPTKATEQDVVRFLHANKPADATMLALHVWSDGTASWCIHAANYQQNALCDSMEQCVAKFAGRGEAWKNERINVLAKTIDDAQAELNKLASSR